MRLSVVSLPAGSLQKHGAGSSLQSVGAAFGKGMPTFYYPYAGAVKADIEPREPAIRAIPGLDPSTGRPRPAPMQIAGAGRDVRTEFLGGFQAEAFLLYLVQDLVLPTRTTNSVRLRRASWPCFSLVVFSGVAGMNKTPNVYEFVGISEVAETTTHLLALALQQTDRSRAGSDVGLGPVEQYILQQARDYLSTVREGFVLSVRTSKISQRSEARYLLDRVLTDWDQLSRELGLEDSADRLPGHAVQAPATEEAKRTPIERVRQQLLAFGMAVVAMGYLPRLPAQQVTFPQSYGKPPTYADIPVPHTPGELLWRIEELEETVWQMMSRDLTELVQRNYGPVRRTYGFFETSAWLSGKEVERFGVKQRRPTLRSF
jgi:hypothetical protein